MHHLSTQIVGGGAHDAPEKAVCSGRRRGAMRALLVAERFRAVYGEDPYDLPLDDPRLNRIHCDIMTEFFRKARKALDEFSPHRHTELVKEGFDPEYRIYRLQELAGNDIGRYLPIWGG